MAREPIHTDVKALILRIAEGDEQAFSSLFTTWTIPLVAVASKILKNEHASQEVVQEVFIKVWLYRDRLNRVENLGAWLRKITVNQSLLALQRDAANDRRLEVIQTRQHSIDHSSTLELKEIRRLVHDVVESLPPQRKMIYLLNRVEGKTTKEIADKLRLSHGYVRNALSAAMAVIKARLTTSGMLT